MGEILFGLAMILLGSLVGCLIGYGVFALMYL